MGANPNILLPGFWHSGAHGIPVPVVLPLLPMTDSELSAVCEMIDSIEAFSNTVTENTCINV
jgi:hypothetical protein